MNYAVIAVDGVRYDINWYKRLGDCLFVLACPELGGIGPYYGLTFEEAEAGVRKEIRDRIRLGGYLDHGMRWDSKHGRWKLKHGYGKETETAMAKGTKGKPKGKKLDVVHGSPGVSNLPPQKR